jgi:two-component system, NarL family, sensor histidine kinase UhpB
MDQLPNILIVDDTPENLMFLEVVLRKINANLIKAFSGSQALAKTQGIELALAIIDVRMPIMNGYELAVKINEDRIIDKVPVIFLTANFFDEIELFKGYGSGAVDYIFKPVDSRILLSKTNVFVDLFNQKQIIINNAKLLKEYTEKLTLVNVALTKSEEKYRSYITNAPDGVFVTDEFGKYIEVNEAACSITGYSQEELLQMSIKDIVVAEYSNDITTFFSNLINKGASKVDVIFNHKDSSRRWLTIDVVKFNKTNFLGFTKDITESKLTHEALKESEFRFRNFFELTADMVAIADIDGNFKEINSSWIDVLGYSKEEILGNSILKYIHPEDEEKTKKLFLQKRTIGEPVLSFENRYLKKDGGVVWLEWTSQPHAIKGYTFAIARDITARKQADAELKNSLEQLHQLTKYIEKVRENERIAISRELHDDLGQSLTAIKIDLGFIKQNVTNPESVVRINKVSSLVGDTIKTVQRLTSQLRPQIIDDLGLDAAIEWHTKEFSERFGIKIFLDLDADITVTPDASLTLFRIMQESLTNIARHSNATRVHISLSKTDDLINFRISDNGIGIKEGEIKSKKSFGIMGMKERAASLGGSLEIYNEKDLGTVVMLIIPLKS